ncbi:MAG: hypothetical protein IJS03_02835 [Eubacterium sp.]|nr:hypothetical protein [Eubacterium sp.]
MKKVFSIAISALLVISIALISATTVFAAVASPVKPTKPTKPPVTEVNGQTSDDVTYKYENEEHTIITFTYTGDGELKGWEFPGMVEGEDYEIISEDGNSITIRLLNDYDGSVVANAIVEEEGSTKAETTKKNGDEKSPKTGAAAATGIVMLGAGAAVLAALKRKEQ